MRSGAAGYFENRAGAAGVAASGWSWSSKFGDLDNDGFQDLLVVNGMAAEEMFSNLPDSELVEPNLAFRNVDGMTFEEAAGWQLGGTAGGRGMTMADLDSDGDLDVIVNNLRASATLFENRLCAGDSIELDLFWPGTGNTRAIGAQARLLADSATYLRDVRSASGYLSGDASRLHFGFPAGSRLVAIQIVWPDGLVTTIDAPQENSLYRVTRR